MGGVVIGYDFEEMFLLALICLGVGGVVGVATTVIFLELLPGIRRAIRSRCTPKGRRARPPIGYW